MALDRLEIGQVLGIFGGTLAASNWVPVLLFLTQLPHLLFLLAPILVFAPALTGVVVCAMSFRAVDMARKMPHRAGRDLGAAGGVGLAVGFICFASFLVLSSIFVVIASIEVGGVAKTIADARRQTGFLVGTVATAAGGPWHRRLSCAYCGAPLVVKSATPRGPNVLIETDCPLDQTRERQQLPLSQLQEWAPILADRLHRCAQCGERTVALILTSQGPLFTTLRPYCPRRHTGWFRRIWTPLYPHVARSPPVDLSFHSANLQPRFQPSIRIYGADGTQPLQPVQPSTYGVAITPAPQPVAMPWQPVVPARAAYSTQFCRVCGVRIEPNDRFCYRCGIMIR